MKIWLITDTHFNHDKMVEFCDRPVNHTQLIGNNLLKQNLTQNDVLIHLGDICIGGDELVHNLYIKPLKCKKWLTLGNHDRKSQNWYLNHGWDWVGFNFTNTFFGKKILFSHIPLPDKDIFDFNIHGHFHNSNHHVDDPSWIQSPKHKLLSIENEEYRPVLLEKFINQ